MKEYESGEMVYERVSTRMRIYMRKYTWRYIKVYEST